MGMPKVVVYTTAFCPYCTRAKELLRRKGISFEEIDLTGADAARAALVERTGMRTVPQILVDGKLVGGWQELQALDREGKLELALAGETAGRNTA
jgi:glutaredoxin 3